MNRLVKNPIRSYPSPIVAQRSSAISLGFGFSQRAGTPLAGRNLNRQLTLLLAKAGLPKIRFHDTRHTAAVLMLAQGIPLKVVSQVLGHSKIATTADIYAHVLPRQEQDAADKMGALLWG